jgi:hypothetical protein
LFRFTIVVGANDPNPNLRHELGRDYNDLGWDRFVEF